MGARKQSEQHTVLLRKVISKYCKHRNFSSLTIIATSDLTIIVIIATSDLTITAIIVIKLKTKTLSMLNAIFKVAIFSYTSFRYIYSRSLFQVFIKDKSLKFQAFIRNTAILKNAVVLEC